MRPLTNLERFFEQLFERPAARLFRPRLQPVQLQRRIERAMETERMSAADRTLVPNQFRVHLNPDDLATFGDLTSTLATELADGALAFARTHRYTLVDRPRVDLVADPGVPKGEIRVGARFAERQSVLRRVRTEAPHRLAPTPDDGRGVEPSMERTKEPEGSADTPAAAGPQEQQDDAQEAARDDEPSEAPDPRLGNQTLVFPAPIVDAPAARLRELRPNGTQREITLDGAPLMIGRASDNGLVIHDSRVSRHHARLQVRRGTLVFTDLESTNGSRVNGSRVAEVALGEGDRIEIGDTVLVVESVSGR
jgi:pSer/pThr/pTyr-binding forkhead associated (FHA) protein